MTDHRSAPGFADERLDAHAWAADLIGLPWPERLRRVREDRAFATPSFIELSISLGRDVGLPASDRQRWAQLAVEAAMRGPRRRAEELESLAWAVLGTAYRVRGRLSAGRTAFKRCHALRQRMTNVLELADTYSHEAAYWWEIAGWSLKGYRASRIGRDGQMALTRGAEFINEALRLATPTAVPQTSMKKA